MLERIALDKYRCGLFKETIIDFATAKVSDMRRSTNKNEIEMGFNCPLNKVLWFFWIVYHIQLT